VPGKLDRIQENVSKELKAVVGADSAQTAMQGVNDFGRFGYGGPCPPPGPAHRYFFRLYSLDTELEFSDDKLKDGVTAKVLTEEMKDHILAEALLMGKYQR
jgi:Raf kinase inhibitor-like YbhB/YbcL family protein